MNKKILSHSVLLPLARVAGTLLAFAAPLSGQQIYNGEHTLQNDVLDHRPETVLMGFGENQDATVNLNNLWIYSGPGMRLADSDGTGTHNTVTLNLDPYAQVEVTSGERTIIGQDGTATVNLISEGEFSVQGATFRPRSTEIAAGEGSFGTVNLDGVGTTWNGLGWAVDIGTQGVGEINLTNGARFIGASRVVVGGSLDTEAAVYGTGYFNIDGPGSEFHAYGGSTSYLSVGHRGTGVMRISNGGLIDTRNGDSYSIYVGRQTAGDGTLIVESGGAIITDEPFRVNHQSSIRGHAIFTGEGTELNVVAPAGTSFVGNTGIMVGEEPPVGILEILDGAVASFDASLRLGNQAGATGELKVDGAGSLLQLGSFIQVGYNGNGTLLVSNGGRVEIPLDGTSFSSFGRVAGFGDVTVEGAGSEISVPRLILGATNAELDPSGGGATLRIRDGGLVTIAGHLGVRGGSVVDLDNGTITMMAGTSADRPDVIDIGHNGSLLTGTGTINSDLVVSEGGSVLGVGDGITLTGSLFAGTVENILASSIEAAPVIVAEDRPAAGPIALNDVRFSSGAAVNVTINGFENVDNLISFDAATDFSEAHLTIAFVPFPPNETWFAKLFNYTGAGEADYNFASISLPAGWLLNDGVLHHETFTPPDETAFESWVSSFDLSGSDATPEASPAGDGFSNLAKFAFGANPTVPTASLAQVSSDGTTLVLRWNRSTDPGVEYTIEENATLDTGTWSPVVGAAPVVMGSPDVTPPVGYERVEWSVDVGAAGERSFYRINSEVDASLLP